ncbi:MAG: hypothetical protein EZS28_030363 [Streblomastix strix]|uniref:OTU domain-containing protein n=1 Tax=Streblomastix strix TaxID=222440 RepID=A0A5J4UVA9_9EUKA|nr:MAG: hypothetical protein EZS28_030363 [Streblomastix strix]
MKYKNNTYFLKLTLTQKRIISVRSTIDGLQQSTTSLSRKNSFETTRLFPRNPVIPTSKDDAIKDLDNPIYPNGRMRKNSAISARVLVTPLKRQRTLLVQEDKEQLEKLKNQNEEQLDEQDTGTKRRRLNDNSFITETNLNVDKQQPSRKQQEKRKIYYKNNPNIPKSELLDDLATLQSELQIEGAYVMNNRGNGNCLFLAIADQLRSRHLNARQIRLQVYEYMLEHGELYEEGFTEEEDIEQYINSMRNDGYYGDGRLFAAICAKFGVRIRIRMIGEVVFDEGDASAPIVELGYIGHIHYVSIRRE